MSKGARGGKPLAYSRASGVLSDTGWDRSIALRVPHFTVIPRILFRTHWMVTVPRGVAEVFNESPQFAIFPLPVALPKFESMIHWHEHYESDDEYRWLRALPIDALAWGRSDRARRELSREQVRR